MSTLPLLEELESALASGTSTRRIEILTRITDLFISGAPHYSEDQISVFDDVMARLVQTIEERARAKLAHRLAPIANAPSNVIYLLAFDDNIDVASPVLAQSERLNEGHLLANARTKSQRHLFAISQRKSLSEALTDVLVERGDRDVVHSVAANSGARFSDAGFRMLVSRSTGDDALATEVGLRRDIPRPLFLTLLEKASSTVRDRLTAENPEAGTAIQGAVAEVVDGIRDNARKASPDFAAAQEAVERQNRIRRIGEAEIYQYARERKFEETAIALSLMCDTPIDVVERALLDPGAEIVLILAKVAGLSSTTTKAILLLRAADRGMSAKDLEQALSSFNRLQPDTARRVLGFFRTRVKKPVELDGPAGRRRQRVGRQVSVRAIAWPHLQPRAVRIAVIATAVPPVIAAVPPLRFRGDDRAGRRTDRSARNRATGAPADRTANDAAQRSTDDRARQRVLRRRLLRRHGCRKRQKHPGSQRAHHHVRSPSSPTPAPEQVALTVCFQTGSGQTPTSRIIDDSRAKVWPIHAAAHEMSRRFTRRDAASIGAPFRGRSRPDQHR